MVNDPYAEFTSDLGPASSSDPYAEFTSDLPSTTPPSGLNSPFMNKAREVMASAGAASNLAPWNKVSQVFPYLGGKVAEEYTSMGLDPKIAAMLGTPLAIAPAIAGTALSLEGLHNAPSPTVKGLMNTPQELGPEYEAQNKAIGVTRRIPQEGGAKPTFNSPYQNTLSTKPPRALPVGVDPETGIQSNLIGAEPLPSNVPIRYPSKPGDFMAYANNRLKFGTQLDPQELMDWQVKLQTDMNNPSAIPKFQTDNFGNPTGKLTTIYQQASDLNNRIQQTFNQIAEPRLVGADLPEGTMPTRSGLNQAARVSYGQQNLQNALKKGGKVARWIGEGGAGLYGLYNLGKKAIGQ
jgi:hypothetical protein